MKNFQIHFEEASEHSAAIFQVISELGRNQHKYSHEKTGFNEIREETLALAKMLGQTEKQFKKIKNLIQLEKEKNNA